MCGDFVRLKLDWAFGFAPYGQELRRHRKALHRHFSPAASEQYHHIEAKATLELLQRLLDTPQDLVAHLRQYVGMPYNNTSHVEPSP